MIPLILFHVAQTTHSLLQYIPNPHSEYHIRLVLYITLYKILP